MSSLVTAVNVSDTVINIDTVELPVGVPVIIYRAKAIFRENVGAFISYLVDSKIDTYDFDNNKNSITDSIAIATLIHNQMMLTPEGYSGDRGYMLIACNDLLDGLKKQLDAFDFTAPGVTVSRAATVAKAHDTLMLLSCGFLSDATEAVQNIEPDTDSDFLAAARLQQYTQLFMAASD